MSLKQLFCPALLFAVLAILTLVPMAVQAEMISDIGAYAWYRADMGVVTAAGSNVITSWEDQSGNERDLSVNGNPTLTTNGNDGLAAVTFDGTDDYLYSTLANWGTATTTTVLAVWKATGYGSQHATGMAELYSSRDSSGRQEFWYTSEENSGEGTNDLMKVYDGALVPFITPHTEGLTEGESLLEEWFVTSATYHSNGSFRVNGQEFDFNLNSTAGLKGLTIGARYDGNHRFVGEMCEFVVFSGALTSQELAAVESELGTRWGIESVVPEPSTLTLLAMTLLGLLCLRRKHA